MTSPDHDRAPSVIRSDLRHITVNAADAFARLAGKRLLITGGAGFLGYYLVQSVLHWNDEAGTDDVVALTVFDNFSRGVPGWIAELGDEALRIVTHDITTSMPADAGGFDYIIHAASIASPTFYRLHPIETMDANVTGLRLLLDHAREQGGVEGFLFMSTSEIYGDAPPEHIPTSETFRGYVSSTGPRASYDESKRFGETLSVNFVREYGLPVTIARPFNNYGPGLKLTDRRVLPDFARDVLADRDIVLLSDGKPTRTFCYVADAVVGYLKILTGGRPGEAYNIGVEEPEVSMAELAQMVVETAADLFGYKGKAAFKESADDAYLVDNPNRRQPDISKARLELGYDPQVGLNEGLERSMIWYAGNREGAEA